MRQGRVEGAEFAYQQAFTENFGFIGNYTYADGKQTSLVTPASPGAPAGDDRLVGTSKNTYNVQGYFENKFFSARVAYTYRSSFYSGLDRSTAFTQYNIGTLSASLGYTMNDHFSITLDGHELEQSDPQVLRAEPGSAAGVLQERLAVLPELPLQALGGVVSAAARADQVECEPCGMARVWCDDTGRRCNAAALVTVGPDAWRRTAASFRCPPRSSPGPVRSRVDSTPDRACARERSRCRRRGPLSG